MQTVRIPKKQRFIFDNVSWSKYTRLLRAFADRHLRLTYDRGVLEIMTLSHEHESDGRFLGRLVVTLTEELNVEVKDGGSTTFRGKPKKKGLEPDDCFWIANESAVRGKTKIDLRLDPPPDLALEVDISRSSMNRMGIYAALRVPEVWRWDGTDLAFFALNAAGQFDPAALSRSFSLPIAPADFLPFLQMRGNVGDNEIIRQFRSWVRSKIASMPAS